MWYIAMASNTRPVVHAQHAMQRDDGSGTADVVGEGFSFALSEGAGEEGGLALAEPCLRN